MGFFSWKTNDTHRSIYNIHSGRKTSPVYLIDNKGNQWLEESYQGYGVFGGKDFYELFAEMNGLENRGAGVKVFHGLTPAPGTLLFPNLVRHPKKWVWKNERPERCPFQGFF